MANPLCEALQKSKETFKESRIFIETQYGLKKEDVLALENAKPSRIIPLYIKFIEYKGINMLEALIYFNYAMSHPSYENLLNATIVNTFRKIENNDYNFIPY